MAENNQIYFGWFSDWQNVVDEFLGQKYREDSEKVKVVEPRKVFIAVYDDSETYSGAAFVLWKGKDRKYYWLEGSHCSCYGLEETGWEPDIYDSKADLIKALHKHGVVPYAARHVITLNQLIERINDGQYVSKVQEKWMSYQKFLPKGWKYISCNGKVAATYINKKTDQTLILTDIHAKMLDKAFQQGSLPVGREMI